jgi:hypothetical protein
LQTRFPDTCASSGNGWSRGCVLRAKLPGVPTVRRIRADESGVLRELRLAALSESPSAFASTHDAEAALPPAHWSQHAADTASGSDSAIFLSRAGRGARSRHRRLVPDSHRVAPSQTRRDVDRSCTPRVRRRSASCSRGARVGRSVRSHRGRTMGHRGKPRRAGAVPVDRLRTDRRAATSYVESLSRRVAHDATPATDTPLDMNAAWLAPHPPGVRGRSATRLHAAPVGHTRAPRRRCRSGVAIAAPERAVWAWFSSPVLRAFVLRSPPQEPGTTAPRRDIATPPIPADRSPERLTVCLPRQTYSSRRAHPHAMAPTVGGA